MTSAKKSAQQVLDRLPDDAAWDDIMYAFYVRQKIERSQRAVADDRTIPHAEVLSSLE
jgi:hypothetical protein